MMRATFALMLASICLVGCSRSGSSQAGPTDQASQSAPPPAAAAASAPAAQSAGAPDQGGSAASQPSEGKPDAFETGAFSPAPPVEPAPATREVTIPAGTRLSVTVLSALASDTSKVEDPVEGSLAKPVLVSGTAALPEGVRIAGSVIEAKPSGRVKGRASIAFRFDRLEMNGETIRMRTATVAREAEADTKSDVKKGGIGAGIGAVVGGVVGGGKGAAIGAVAGGAGGVLATRGDEVEVPAGAVVDVLLQDALTVTVPSR
jgi:hypothetical protein